VIRKIKILSMHKESLIKDLKSVYATTPYAVPTLRELVVENVGKNIQHWISLETTVTRIIQVLYNAYLQKIHWIF